MARYNGLIIPRSYNDYFSRSDPQAIRDIVSLAADGELNAESKNPLQNQAIAKIVPVTASPDNKLIVQSQISGLTADVETIKNIIPNTASETNVLADKNFVNSTVGTNTANYIYKTESGGEKVPFSSVAELEAYAGTVTNNDYAFVTGIDENGNAYYDRYKADVNDGVVTWAKEYRLNNSSFTAEQWAAIQSGITAEKVAQFEGAVSPVDVVQSGNMSAVTSNAVYEALTNATRTNATSHNIPRLVPKDITAYITDGTFWKRLAGTDGYALFEDIYVGDYFKMSRAISAYERTGHNQTTGSQYVTIAGLDTMMNNGDQGNGVDYHHAVMVAGQGFGGTQHFGNSRMNATDTTEGGYKASEMNTLVLGEVTSTGSTAADATINQQLYAEFGSHLKTTRELVSNAVNATGYNRFGSATGCASNWEWISAQAILMSEVEVYGAIVWGSSGYDTGNANIQLPLFAFSKQAQNNRTAWYWLKDVANDGNFCAVDNNNYAGNHIANNPSNCVRPRFIIA